MPPHTAVATSDQLPDVTSSWVKPISGFLEVVEQRGLCETPGALQPDEEGMVYIGVPFCFAFQECRRFVEFVDRVILPKLPASAKVHIFGTDIVTDPRNEWERKEEWVRENYPRIELSLRQMDLSTEELPPANLTFGIHPEVNGTKRAEWVAIIQNVLRSAARGGLAIFAHITDREVNRIQDICTGQGWSCEVLLNPCYEGMPSLQNLMESSTLPLLFVVVARPLPTGH